MLLNDKEIKRRVKEEGMIEPFVPELVREYNGKKVISYGLSSFGYDLRLSPKDFRIFRHVPGEIINPKRFNPKHLEQAELHTSEYGEYFILPGHSYGLGVVIEKLNIPRDITCLFLGKSTYARCFSGDTQVKLVDGDFTFLELIDRVKKGHSLFGYGVRDKEVIIQELTAPRFIEKSPVVTVVLSDGSSVDCTPDHKFMREDGSYEQAIYLKKGDRLFPTNQNVRFNYVLKVEEVSSVSDTSKDTYCLTAETGNFLLSVGAFVSNCGVVPTLTPGESRWSGYLTVEISNHSSADAMVFSSEGVVQTLFLKGDPSEVSYEDRRGKYQDQPQEVTLARV